jgi:hypothetical protein
MSRGAAIRVPQKWRSLTIAYAQVGKNVSSGRHRLTTGPRWTLVFSMKVKEQEER